MPRKAMLQVRRGTAAAWSSANPVLAAGELGFVTDTNALKVGDGVTAWNSLSALGGTGSGVSDHGALTGLADDDHTQYFNTARGDARYSLLGHSHVIADVTGLQAALDGKQAAGSYAAASHGHIIADVTGLQTALDGKQAAGSYAAASHGHIIADVTGLQTALDGKQAAGSYAAASHVHAAADTTSGVFAPARLGTGTPSGSNFLRGDGTWAVPAGGASPVVATLAGNQATGANTTPVTLTGLSFSYEANSLYRIWAMGRVQPAAATTGCGFQLDLTTTVDAVNLQFFHQLANAGTLSGGHSIADDASVGVSSGMPGTSTYPVVLFGLLDTNANAGTAQLRFRSETTAVTTCLAGFTLVVEKIA